MLDIATTLNFQQSIFFLNLTGNTTCLDCGNEDMRQYFVVPVPRTNLVLVVVEYFAEKAVFQYTKRMDDIPGTQKESILLSDGKTCST